MPEIRRCTHCGAEIPAGSPVGFCPKCLLQVGFESHPGTPHATNPTEASPASAAGFVPPLPSDLAARFPQLEILELLGKGGMGAVYKARQRGLDRLVALKILPPEIGRDPAFAERFTREARALAHLSHTNIVGVYDFGQTDGLFYFVMEYVDGLNLRQAIQARHMTPADALAIVPQICDALQFAHDEGVVHRDIKPENILIDKRGRVKIADFGLAKLLGHDHPDVSLTGSHQVMGTVRYMAPEQMERSHEVDHRADIFSLGVVFYELLTGELPVGRFPPPSKKVQVDVRLDEIVLRALEKEPEQRYQHASEVKTAIEQAASKPAVQAPSEVVQPPLPFDLMPKLVVTVLGGVLGNLSMAVGIALAAFAALSEDPQSGQFWGWIGGAFGCFFGGGGAVIGSINSYRQMAGAESAITAKGRNWLNCVRAAYALLGIGAILFALAWRALASPARYSLLLFGAMVITQAGLFWFIRLRHTR